MTEYVAVIRLRNGEDVLAFLIGGKVEQMVRVEHPYYVKFNPISSNLTMVPYCALSEETYFEINRDRIEFIVPASTDIAAKFVKMVESIEQNSKLADILNEDKQPELFERSVSEKNLIEGNDTKH